MAGDSFVISVESKGIVYGKGRQGVLAPNGCMLVYLSSTSSSSLQPPRLPAPYLLSLFLALQPSPPWKSQIAHLDMHHLFFGINFQIHSVSLTILVSIYVLIHFSTHLSSSPLSSSITPSLFHSRLKTYLFNKSFLQPVNLAILTIWSI